MVAALAARLLLYCCYTIIDESIKQGRKLLGRNSGSICRSRLAHFETGPSEEKSIPNYGLNVET